MRSTAAPAVARETARLASGATVGARVAIAAMKAKSASAQSIQSPQPKAQPKGEWLSQATRSASGMAGVPARMAKAASARAPTWTRILAHARISTVDLDAGRFMMECTELVAVAGLEPARTF